MTTVIVNPKGGYRYIEGVFQYSGGVAAEPGFRIERVRFQQPMNLRDGFAAIEAHLKSLGRPMHAFCACELRSPKPFDEESFAVFNRQYVDPMESWGVFHNGKNPIARTNVCPVDSPPATPSLYAFSYTVECQPGEPGGFVIAGSAEAPEGKGGYKENTIRLGDVSPDGLKEKAAWVASEMERRMSLLGYSWKDTTGVGLYTVHNVHPFLEDVLLARGAGKSGLTWHYSRPPVEYLDFEMDARGVMREIIL